MDGWIKGGRREAGVRERIDKRERGGQRGEGGRDREKVGKKGGRRQGGSSG